MKKQLSLLVGAVALVGMTPAFGAANMGARAGSSVDLSGSPAVRTRQNVDYAKYQTRSNTSTYSAQDGRNMYYTQPSNRSAMYKQYASGSSSESIRTSRAETVRTELKRKYYLAHPFYQPLAGKFGSVTDLSYASGGYDLTLNQTVATPLTGLYELDGVSGNWKYGQFSIKEDFSYGITDKVALLGMLRYESTKYEFDWDDANYGKDKQDDNGLNLYGFGAQWRVVDTADWIGELSAYFQHQKDMANNYVLELKAGYKVSRSTIYGLVRGWYLDMEHDMYGNGVDSGDTAMFLAYKKADHAVYVEGGLGVFSVLDEDWTLNVEGVFGHYDWHNQLSLKGEIGWQPNDWFALSLYAHASLVDSADSKKLDWYFYEPAYGFNDKYGDPIGTAKLDNNQEWSIGTRVIFQF